MATQAYHARLGYLDGLGLVESAFVEVDERGIVRAVRAGVPPIAEQPGIVVDLGDHLLLPGFVCAHSHAFQRAIRGCTARRAPGGSPDDFWSWREAMYGAAAAHGPESLYAVTRDCYAEMLEAGITCVGEFHYLHHQPDGTAYERPNELGLQIVAAAREVGIRLVLLDVYYARAGAGQTRRPEQRRFCDEDIESYLRRVESLRDEVGDEVTIGIAPHSVRAVGRDDLRVLAEWLANNDVPVHAHVSEQRAENAACLAEHGRSPTAVLADAGLLTRPGRFTAIHAIHVDDHDRMLLRGQTVCACPTTEADLGDGIVTGSAFERGGVHLALGSDSNAVIDLVQEARLLEMHERLSAERRLRLGHEAGSIAECLLAAATTGGARALARSDLGRIAVGSPFDAVAISLSHRIFQDLALADALEILMLHGDASTVERVWVGGRRLR
jgi:formimidoylglutamate deiminase